MKIRSFSAQRVLGLLLAAAVASVLTGCGDQIYKQNTFNYSGRLTPPSGLQQRVLASYTFNGSSGGLAVLDGLRDLRGNVQNTVQQFSISGYSAAQPAQIISYPEQTRGYILSATDGTLGQVDYGKETSVGSVASFGSFAPSVAAAPDGTRFAGASENAGQLVIVSGGATIALNLPNVYRVAMNQGNTVILAMVRNSNLLYRVVKLPATTNPVVPPGSVDCQPMLLPVYCVVPVPGTYDRPQNATFSTDGSMVFVLNAGPELAGGKTASVTVLNQGALTVDTIPTVNPLAAGAPSPLTTLPAGATNPILIPGGVTMALSNGTTLYLAGQSLFSLVGNALDMVPRADGLFTGFVTAVDLTTFRPGIPAPISDGLHTRMLFADDSSLWIGSQQCANGERAKAGGNANCLTRVSLPATAPTATTVLATQLIPALTPGGATKVPYPNADGNAYYYGSLTGICWVQNFHKVYTAYGGQIHAFNTADGSEINNTNITIQGTVLDVAYMDALTNSAN